MNQPNNIEMININNNINDPEMQDVPQVAPQNNPGGFLGNRNLRYMLHLFIKRLLYLTATGFVAKGVYDIMEDFCKMPNQCIIPELPNEYTIQKNVINCSNEHGQKNIDVQCSYYENGEVKNKLVSEYNENGKLARTWEGEYNENQTLVRELESQYNEKRELVRTVETEYNASVGLATTRKTTNYHENGEPMRIWISEYEYGVGIEVVKHFTTEYNYNYNGEIMSTHEDEYIKLKQLVKTLESEYNSKGHVVKTIKTDYSEAGHVTRITESKYNENDEVICTKVSSNCRYKDGDNGLRVILCPTFETDCNRLLSSENLDNNRLLSEEVQKFQEQAPQFEEKKTPSSFIAFPNGQYKTPEYLETYFQNSIPSGLGIYSRKQDESIKQQTNDVLLAKKEDGKEKQGKKGNFRF